MIELHSMPTPNGRKLMIMLEETGLEWRHIDVNITLGDQFSPEFLKLSPNNKIPAIIDTDVIKFDTDIQPCYTLIYGNVNPR